MKRVLGALRRGNVMLVALMVALMVALTLGAAAMAQVPFNPGVGPAGTCNRVLSPGGNVSNFVNGLSSGQRGCLRGGIYTTPNSIKVTKSGVTLAGYPGERAEVRASTHLGSTSNVRFEGFKIDASYSPITTDGGRVNTEQGINLGSSSGFVAQHMEVVNRRSADRSDTCIFGGTSRNAKILQSWVHQCGELPRTNREHGFYVANSTGALIEHSWFSDIADRCLSFHPDVRDATARGVVCDSHHGGPAYLLGGSTSGVLLENSVGYSDAVYSVSAPNLTGTNNVVRNNCFDDPVDADPGISYSNNVTTTPQISGFKVTGPGSCTEKLPLDSPFRP